MTRRQKLILAGALAAAAVAGVLLLPLEDWLLSAAAWVERLGVPGALAFVGLYAALTVALVPGSLLTLAAGFVYGPLVGYAVVAPASVLGATGAFLVGRTLLRDQARRWAADSRRFRAVDRAIGERPFTVVALLRLSPVLPFNVLNYALGLTPVATGTYVLASWLGMIPGTFLYVYIGSTLQNLGEVAADEARGGVAGRVLFWGGLAATAVVVVVVTRMARTVLQRELDEAEEAG